MTTTPIYKPTLETPIMQLRSVGARSATRLQKLGIATVRQLLWHLPARYDDFRQSVPIADVIPGQKMSIQGRVLNIASRQIWPRRMTITTATIQDASGAIRATWFNQPYLVETLAEGTLVSMSGKVVLDKRGLYMSGPVYEKISEMDQNTPENLRHTGRLIPVYPETAGITSKYLRYLIQPLLEEVSFTDPMPPVILKKYGLIDLATALKNLHYPDQVELVPPAKERLAFDDLLMFQLKALHDRREINRLNSIKVPLDSVLMKKLVAGLPFTLTKDQRLAAAEILGDMAGPYPMNRLLEGDVGSGKTVVAILAALHASARGLQTAFLAPTEVLAHQHYRTLRQLLPAGQKVSTALVTSSTARLDDHALAKTKVKKAIAAGQAQISVGTQALLQEDLSFASLALVVVDEQHRFGINQRAALTKASRHAQGQVPHLLSMTATPIPRTLALTIFGDLDVSVIREKPKGRQIIKTNVVPTAKREDMYAFIRAQVKSGRQVFVICPRIEIAKAETPKFNPLWADVKAVQDEHEKLSKKVFPDLRVAMLHGRLKPKDKQAIMQEFKDGWQDILVSTSVIEVGVDVPNATIMLIEGADMFGLAQLHQFRGRVGRGAHQSYCFLIPTDEGAGRKRLTALEKTDDGFVLAEADMKIRGPGEFFGIKQSGLPDLTMAALANLDLIQKARTAARAIAKTDPDLKRYPLLKVQLESFRKMSHFE